MIGSLQLLRNSGAATGPWLRWTGGKGFFTINGTLVTGTLETLSTDDITAIPVRDINGSVVSLAAAGSDSRTVDLPPCQVRYRATVGTGIYAQLDPVPR